MIEEIKGNIFKVKSNILVHQTNCVGAMGVGIAKQVRELYPKVYNEYYKFIKSHKNNSDCLGECFIADVPELDSIGNSRQCEYIANLFGQDKIDRGKQNTDYDAFKKGLNSLKSQALDIYGLGVAMGVPIVISFPFKIGSARGGGDWNIVYGLIKECFENDERFEIKIVKYNGN